MANEVNESTKWLYEQLNGKGYNVGKDVNEFDSLMRSNADSRQWAYDTAKKSGLNVGKDIDEFSSLVGGTTTSAPVVEPAPIPANDIQPKTEAEQEAWKPTPMQKAFMIKSVQSSLDDFNNNSNSLIQHTRNMAEYMKHGESIVGQPAKAGLHLNPEAGSVEEAYITPSGYKTTDKAAADNESFNHRRYVDNMTVAGQLRRAGRDLDYLTDKAAKRRAEIIDEVRKRQQGVEAASGLLDKIYQGIRSGDTMTSPSGDFMDEVNDVLATDREYRALEAARREAEKRVQTIQHENDRQEDKDVGFWRGLREVVSDSRTWDFGFGDMRDAMTKVAASSKRPENRSDAEHMMIEQAYEAQQAEAAYSQNDSFWNRAGVMTGEMLPFMLDFAIMGGAKSGATTVTRGLDAILLRSIHKTAPKVARNKAVQWTTKALGALPEDLLYRAPLMTNTVQGMKTSADIIDRKLGDAVIRDDGSYDFSNDKTWGSAVWQGEANAIIENYSEMFGPHLEGALSLKTVGKLADTFGAKRLSGMLTKASNSELAGITGTMQKHLDRLGVSDYFGEVGEEYYGQLWRTMLNLDDAYKQNPDGSRTNLFLDGQFHGDIWGGMALSMGLMGAGKYTLSAAAYGSMKHRVNKTDARASETFTPEVWEGWRERIDGTTNDKVGEMAEAIVADPTLTDEQRTAAMNYMEASLNLRGFNLASVAHQRGGEPSEEEVAANESYMDGYSAETPQEMNDAKRMLALQRQRLASSLSEDVIPEFDADPIGALSRTHDSELRRIASDYVNAKQVYEGMIQRVRDDIDGRIAQSDAMIDSRVNHQTGMIQPATMKIDDRKVYIVNGTVSMYDDGSGIDIQNSSESIIIRDAETGKVEFTDPTQLFNIEDGIDAEAEKDSARSQIIEETALAAADNIDGVLSFTPGDIYPILDLEGNQQSISVLGQTADENGMAIDGHVDIQYSDGSIEAVATSDLQQWVDKANEQRVAQFIAEQESEPNSFEIVEPITETQPESIEAPQKAVEINPETENSPLATEPDVNNYEETPASFISRIPVDESTGEPIYEQAEPADAWDAIVESAKGNEDKAQRVVESMVSDMEAEVKRLEKQKPNKGRTIAEKMAAEDALEEARTIAQSNLSKWKAIAGVRESRITEAQRLEAEAELKRQIEADQEARRIERQARDEERASRPGEYAKAMSAWEEPTSIEERILRDLSSGGIKLRWSDKGKTRGLGAHLFGGSNTERRWNGEYGNYKWLVDDNAGLLPEEYAEHLAQEYYNDYENDSDHYAETFVTVLDVLGSYASSKDMWERAQELHQGNLEAQASAEDFERMEMEARGITEEDIERDRIYREKFGMPEDEWDEFYLSNGTEIDMPDEEYSEYFNNLAGLRADQENEQQGLQQTATDTGEQGRTDTVSENSTGMVRDAGLYRPEASEVWRPEGNNQESSGDVSLRDDEGNGEKGNIIQSSPSDINLEEQDAEEDVLRSRIEVKDDDWTEGNGYTPTLKRTIIIDGTHNVTQVDTPNDKGDYTGSVFEYDGKTFGDLQEVIGHIDSNTATDNGSLTDRTLGEMIAEAEAEVNTDPTDKQKEAGNYKKGHVQVGTFDVTIENPKGSKRSGTDADGKKWETTMTHTYGYILGTKGVDGDHIDVYISSDIDGWNGRKVFVVDQYNPDGSFDEHKVMLGFNDKDEAFEAYLSNYEAGWEKGRRLVFSTVSLEDFEKWIESSHRKQKPFNEYKSVHIENTHEGGKDELHDEVRQWLGKKGLEPDEASRSAVMRYFKIGYNRAGKILNAIAEENAANQQEEATPAQEQTTATSTEGYTIVSKPYTNKQGKTLDTHLVTFDRDFSKDDKKRIRAMAKEKKGWQDRETGGYMLRSREDAEEFAASVMNINATSTTDAPVSLSDIESAIKPAETEISSSPADKPADAEAKPEKKPSKWVDDEDAEEFERLRKILRNGLGQLNSGFPPELLYAGGKMSYLMMKHGVRKFAEYASAMVEELGDAIRPHLKSLYNFTRSTEEVMESEWADELTPFDEVMKFDTANFGKPNVDAMATAENVVAEEASQQHLEDAVNTIKDSIRQNPDGSTSQTINEGGTEIEVTEGDFIPGVYPPIDDKPTKPGKKKPSKPKPTEQKPTTGQLDLFEEEEEQIINDIIDDTTPPEPKPEAELSGDSADYQERTRQERDLVDDIVIEIMKRTDMRERGDEKVTLTMRDIRGMLENYSLLADISATDLQELVERAMTILTRTAAKAWIADQKKGYDRVVAYYNAQPMLNTRDSSRVERQQYSTPTPFGYVMGQFVNAKNDVKSVLEPSAGNGALTIMFDPASVHVNDIDERRLENLRTLGYGTVTNQNALLPFEGEQVDGVLTNPPFGTTDVKVYDGIFKISSLEGQMAINALDAMKDNGRAAIVIGGNTEYRENGVMKPKDMAFFGYLYSHYNVVDVINMDGEMYARNGTKYPVRIILINGRKTGEFSRVIPPVKSKGRAEQVKTFDELYNRIQDDISQVFKMGSEPSGKNDQAAPTTDRGESKPNSGRNNTPNNSDGSKPVRAGEASTGGRDNAPSVRDVRPAEPTARPNGESGGNKPASGVDNGNGGNAGSGDNVPGAKAGTDTKRGEQQRDEPRGNRGSDGVSATDGDSTPRQRPTVSLSDEKVPYPNQSASGTLMSVVPATQAEALSSALNEIGDVDQFLVDKLGYSSKEELYGYLAAEQVDSVSLAINQMSQGNGFIIGDMTGVGKGRQGAALIRYGVREGKNPIYFTQEPALFSDNYRDLADIGSGNLRPFIIASDAKNGNITDANGNVVHRLPSKKEFDRVYEYVRKNGKLPKEYDYVLVTYSQIQNGMNNYEVQGDGGLRPSPKTKTCKADVSGQRRRELLDALSKDNIMILDESHTVGGQGGGSMFMQYIMQNVGGVTFLSATFAKRADNMPIYAMKTAMSESGMQQGEMIDAIASGGVTLQEIMSKQLVQSGQMIRRERSFQGVTIDWMPVDEEKDKIQREQFDEVANIFNSIRAFQEDYIKPLIDQMSDDIAESGSYAGITKGTEAMGVRNTPFASKMYNLVNQLLFALKADAVADRVIWNLQHGFKPVISFTNTMEGFLDEAPKDTLMDEIPDFSITLMRALDGVMRYTVTDADNNNEGGRIPLSQLGEEGEKKYNEIRDRIMNLSADLPISPMDAIRMKIEAAGYKVGEITGRNLELAEQDGKYVVHNRKDKDKKAAARDFNSGALDVLMVNKSGSTGISLHASSKFADTRQRVMVFAQFQSDINDEVQMRGRIDRTGQLFRGKYEYIVSSIPAEQRLQMMFKAKLKSLDANTTSSQKSKFNEMQVVDYLNKYGDEVTWQYMQEHPELEEKLGDPLKMLSSSNDDENRNPLFEKEGGEKDGCAAKIARYLPFLTVAEQEEVFKDITEAYAVKIQLLNDAGENDLEITTMPLKAETKSRKIWKQGTNPGSGNAFADNTYLEEVEVDVLKKPMKAAEIRTTADRLTNGKPYEEWKEEKADEIKSFFDNKIEATRTKLYNSAVERAEKQREKARQTATRKVEQGKEQFSAEEINELAESTYREVMSVAQEKIDAQVSALENRREDLIRTLNSFTPLQPLVIPTDLSNDTGGELLFSNFGTFLGFKFHKDFSLGSSTAIFATLDGRRKVEIPLNNPKALNIIRSKTMFAPHSVKRDHDIEHWDSNVPTRTRKKAYIVTGNLLQALVDTQKGANTKGYLISYSTIDGDVRQGILMPDRFTPADLRNSAPIGTRISDIRNGAKVESENGEVSIELVTRGWENRGDYELRVPKSTSKGGRYFTNPALREVVKSKEFSSKGGNMVAYILPENLEKTLDVLGKQLGVTVLNKSQLKDGKQAPRNVEDEDNIRYRIREDEPPKQTGIGYKVFVLKNGMLYPPMVANPNGEATPVGVWLDADAAPIAGTSKTGRQQVKAGGKGTQGGSGKLAYRPGWHLGVIPYALQFNRKGESGEKELFPANFVWAEVEYADDIDYQDEAMSYGYNKNGKFQHSYAGLPRLPINGAYKYRTNPNPETDPWIITGAMKVNRLLTPSEVDDMVRAAGREPQKRQNGAVTDEQINSLNAEFEQRTREGDGAYSDAELSMENDPWSKAWGESIRTKRQQKQFAEKERNRMRERAKSLSSVLGIDIEVIDDASTLKGKKQRAKGWYDTKTGKITVVVSNHNSASDMEATILHEAVAHHGLRQLLGEHFDEFLDKVYEAAENNIKEQIDLLAIRNGWNRRIATEEYLAGLAERTDFDRAQEHVGGWFDKIKRFFFDMLFKAGFKHITPGSISDNELRYILWRSYQNLVNPGRYRAFEWEAEDVAMQYKLQVGEYDANSNNAGTAADEDIRFRDGDFTPRDRVLAAQQYERMLSRGSWQFREATQDSMLGLKALYESILGSNLRIENVDGYENAYLYENRMSSANNGEQHQYFSRFMKPLLESIHKLCGSKELDRRILTDYMIAKHGLERNKYMRNEAAANGEDTERDFAGLCGLTGEDDWHTAETVAQQMVDDYEANHDTAELWNNVKKATNATLEKIYLSGLISEDTYNKVLGMYDFYIPLRGWDETTSDKVYGYLTSNEGPLSGGNVFKRAGGRPSKSDDPIATIAMMADDAIRQGNRNIMKQRFLNFVHGNPSDLVSINEMWLQHNDVTDEWEPVFADLQPDMTHAEVESEIAKFEAKMEALRTAEPDKYKKGRDARNIPYKVVRGNLNEHQVLVKRNGRTYVMTINGNPRAAQALNGLTNPNVDMGGVIGNMLKLGEYVNRQLSAFYTTRNPDFVVSNFLRDMLYSNCMTWVKENPRYALRFHKNFGKVTLSLRSLLSKWENDSLSDSNYLEKMFKEFMLNGGETGYTSVKDIEGHKRTIAKELKKLNKRDVGNKTWQWLGGQLDLLNRSAENCARFAAFLTSREMGRTLDRSIYDAKEVSVNFNKKGSGGKFVNATGQKFLGKLGSYLGGGGRIAYVFWNAGIQGMTNFGRAGKRNPGKALGGAAALFTLGYVIPLLAQMLGGGDGDDDDKNAYYNLPEYVRRSNICFKAGEQWITIPLPIEYRAIYGMGELACGVISGNERYSNSELTRQMASQVSQIMPLDMLEGGGGISPFIPSAFKPMTEAYILNKGWTGLPVYKDTPYNKYDPEWTKAYQSADQHLVAFTKWLNETSGGNDYKKGAIDINPAKLEYLLSGTFGGVVSTTGKLKKMGETALGEREFEWRNMLLANRVIKSGDERTANRKLQNEYFKYLNEYEETDRLRKKYENAADNGILGYAERADFLYNSPEYLRFEIFEEYKPDIDAIREEIKEETDPDAKKELHDELFATMRELVDELHRTGK